MVSSQPTKVQQLHGVLVTIYETEMCKLPFLRLIFNHDYPGIHPDWIKHTDHNLTTQEAIAEYTVYWF